MENRSDPLAAPVALVALLTAVADAIVDHIDLAEFEPNTIPDATLTQWTREPGAAPPAAPADPGSESDGRWFWALALALIAIERPIRNRARRAVGRAASTTPEETHRERVA